MTAEAPGVKGVPQPPQNLSSGSFGSPHDTHATERGAPQWEQNLRPGRFSFRQLRQTIRLLS